MSGSGVDGLAIAVGLGNPGAEFDGTRHNVGADAVRLVAGRLGLALKAEKGTSARLAATRAERSQLVLAVPVTYMNDSGLAVQALVRRYAMTDLSRLVVVHDELDLPVGVVKVKLGGGTAGHNGLRSIEAHLHSLAFVRVRIGIGKPPGRKHGVGHVLSRPGRAEREELAVALEEAADAVEMIAMRGVDVAMNSVNSR